MAVVGVRAERACNTCTALTSTGNRCGRTTCVIGPECWQHTQQNYWVRVKPAKYGMGLFAQKPGGKTGEVLFRPGDFICWYSKKSENPPAVPDHVKIEYGLGNQAQINNPYKTNDHPGRYANDCNDIKKVKSGDEEYKKDCRNAKLVRNPKTGKAKVVCKRPIKQGEEILVAYGKGYWVKKREATAADLTGKRTRKQTERLGQVRASKKH
jgi:hypothetical protein